MQNNILDNPVFEIVRTDNKLFPFLKTKHYFLKETGSLIKKETIHFNKNQLPGLMKTLSEQAFATAKPINIVSSQGSCYMEIAYTEDKQFAAVLLFEYVPFEYHPVNEMYQFRGQAVNALATYMERCKSITKA